MMHFANPTSRGAAVGLAIWACLGCGLTVGTARLAPTRLSAQPHTQPQPQPPTQPRPQPPTQPRTQPQPVQLSLHDQYDRVHSLEMYRGRVLVLIYGDKQSQGINQPLGERLHVQFHPAARNLPPAQARLATPAPVAGQPPGAPAPDVVVIPVACVGKVPAAVRSIIRNQIRRGSPDVPVWLDFEDTMKLSFGLTEGTSNAVVFDTLGRYRYPRRGRPRASRLSEVGADDRAMPTRSDLRTTANADPSDAAANHRHGHQHQDDDHSRPSPPRDLGPAQRLTRRPTLTIAWAG
jgi:hypothetical protein